MNPCRSFTLEAANFKCDVCGGKFTRKNNVLRHLIRMHADIFDKSPVLPAKTPARQKVCAVPKYECDICGRKFTRKLNLRKHIAKFHASVFNSSCILPVETGAWRYVSKISLSTGFLRVTLNTVDVEIIRKWIKEYGSLNHAVYVRTCSKRDRNNATSYYEQNNCQHYKVQKDGKKKKLTKGRGCPSKIFVSVRKTNVTEISINEHHNHALDSADIMHFRKPSKEVENQYVELFASGLGPAAAYSKFTADIRMKCGSDNEWMQLNCDRSKVPDLAWVYKFFSRTFEGKYRAQRSREETISNLKSYLKGKETYCQFKEVKNDFVIAICTPLMQRISTLLTAGEVVFLDSTGGVDRFGFKIFLLLVNTKAGGCPIGVFITTSETAEVIEEALSLYLTFVNEDSFGGRGMRGPKCFITDDREAEIVVLRRIFPEANLLLCIFRFMKAVFQWVRKSQNGVLGKDHLVLYNLMKNMVHANTEEIFNSHYLILSQLPCVEENGKIKGYFSEKYTKRKQWALCYRFATDMLVYSSYTTNYSERATQIIKEEILDRRQILCPSQLVDYFTIAYDNHYKHTITNIALDKDCSLLRRNSKLDVEEFEKNYEVKELMEAIYEVLKKEGKVHYIVDAEVGCCSCHLGINGGLCKHIKFLSSKLGLNQPVQFPTSAVEKQDLYLIATGENMPEEFIPGLKEDICSNPQDGITIEEVFTIPEDCTFTEVVIEDYISPSESCDEENVDQLSNSFAVFKQEVNEFCEKYKGRADVAEALSQAAAELRKLRNGPATEAVAALECFNRSLEFVVHDEF